MLPHYSAKILFFAELINKSVTIPNFVYIPLFVINGALIWLIGKKLLKSYSLIPVVIYLLSPWFYYLTFAHSFYIFLLFTTLVIAYGLINIISDNKPLGVVYTVVGATAAAYSSSLFLILLPALFALLIVLKIANFKTLKTPIILLIILTVPLFILIGKNKIGFKNNLAGGTKIFSDPGLLNSINRYQGAAAKAGLRSLSRISENKYLFFVEYTTLKYAMQLVPEATFSPQYKLLGFSFSPPILLGFVLPFLYGLYKLLQNQKIRRVIIFSSLLVIPSILGKDMVSLNRLVIFSPVIIFVISYGLIQLYALKKNIATKSILLLTIILVIFQLVVTIYDIKSREPERFVRYLGTNYQLTEP